MMNSENIQKFNSITDADCGASSLHLQQTPCYMPYCGEKVLIGLSGGINSMAVLCDLAKSGVQPGELHLFYAHFEEHSPDTLDFVKAGFQFAKKHFNNVKTKITYNEQGFVLFGYLKFVLPGYVAE